MSMRTTVCKFPVTAVLATFFELLTLACGDGENVARIQMTTGGAETDGTASDATDADMQVRLDLPASNIAPDCDGDVNCELIDVLFVIDNSATMGEEQLNLARNFPRLIERLTNLRGPSGDIQANVNLMVTTSDFGHPLCTEFFAQGYAPRKGAPVFTGCNERIDSFTSPHPFNPTQIPEACTQECPSDVIPGGDPFIHFDPTSSNVPMGKIGAALSCVAPQGIEGCGFEAPLETMLQALRPTACWNDPEQPGCAESDEWGWVGRGFIRSGSTLAIVIVTDEADCSVRAPEGFSWFTDTDNNELWAQSPDATVPLPSSGVCWRAGVDCTDSDGDGIYETCATKESEVLHSTRRYIDFLKHVQSQTHNDIVMLGVLGVPQVTQREELPPFSPLAGGVADLVYRDWKDGAYDGTPEGGDILPNDWDGGITAAHKQWEFGIGPGCTGTATVMVDDGKGGLKEQEVFTGQAVPPARILEVCESLNLVDEATGQVRRRCCIESICDDDFSPAIDCLSGIIQETINPVG